MNEFFVKLWIFHFCINFFSGQTVWLVWYTGTMFTFAMPSTVSFSAASWLANAAPSISASTRALRSTSLSLCWPLQVMEDNSTTFTQNCILFNCYTWPFPTSESHQTHTYGGCIATIFYTSKNVYVSSNCLINWVYDIKSVSLMTLKKKWKVGGYCKNELIQCGINKNLLLSESGSYWLWRLFSCSLSKILMLLDIASISSSCSSESCWWPRGSRGCTRLFW